MDQPIEGNPSFTAMMAGAVGHARRRKSNRVLQNRQAHDNEHTLSNQSEELRATNDDDVDSGISPSNRSTRWRIPSDDQYGTEGPLTKKKRLQRLTSQQAQLLEGFFTICAHPDESQRRQLSETTGLGIQQVKFWFQNKRTQVKHLSGKEENYRLKVENEMLRDENRRLKQSKRTTICPNCVDSPAQNQLAVEMERLKEQNEWLQQEISRLHAETPRSSNLSIELDSSAENFVERQNGIEKIAELAKNAMDEFVILAESNGPLWLPVSGGSLEILNKMAYVQSFPGKDNANIIGFHTEATRADAVVMMDAKNIVDYLMDPECYESFCPGILLAYHCRLRWGYATGMIELIQNQSSICEKFSTGKTRNCSKMAMETVFPSPLVPSRKCTFLRYCQELQDGAVVVDVSLDDGDGTFFKCRKMPSGVLIQSLRPNSCKVTAIEHVQVDDAGLHELYQPCLSGLMFGARRWLTSMAPQCARMRDVFHVTKSSLCVSSKGRKTLMKLADDLLVSYAGSITATPGDAWTVLHGAGTDDDGTNTAIVSVSASFPLPMPLRVTFDLLRNNMLRPKWDVLVNGGVVKEEVRVSNGVGPDDAVSIVHVKQDARDNIMILQNSCYSVSGSFMVYSPIDTKLMNRIMSSSDLTESKVTIYPTGFSLLPDGESGQGGAGLGEDGGTLVTVGFQLLLKPARGTGLYPKSVAAAISLMSDNIATIKKTLTKSHPIFYRRGQPPSPI